MMGTSALIGITLGMMPDTAHAVDMQQALFQTSLATGQRRDMAGFNKLSTMAQTSLGQNQSSIGAAQRSMAVLSQMGFDPSSVAGKMLLNQTGGISLSTGMDNEQVAGILGSQTTNPMMTNRLRSLGYETFGDNGEVQSPDKIADHLVRVVYGPTVTPTQIQKGIRPGGALDAMLRDYVPDPGMQMVVRDALFKRAFASTSAEGSKVVQNLNPTLNPRKASFRYNTSESAKANAFRPSAVSGYTAGLDAGSSMNDAFTELATNAGILSTALQGLQTGLSALDGFGSTTPGQVTFSVVGQMLGALHLVNGGEVTAALFDAVGAKKFATGGEIAAYGRQFVGVPYVKSDELPGGQESASPKNGWDCATFTWYVLKHFGINAPNYTGDYETDSYPKHIEVGKDLPGDLILFRENYHHIGINLGGGQMVHAANPSSGTVIGPWKNDYWFSHLTSILRYWDGKSSGVQNDYKGKPPDSTTNTGSTSTSSTSTPATSSSGGMAASSARRAPFMGVSLSVGVSGLKATAQSVLSFTAGTAPWADLSQVHLPGRQSSSAPSSDATAPSSGGGTYSGPSGKGPKWLKSFVKAHQVSDSVAHILWAIGMRESDGDPANISGQDYGVWQINDSHLNDIQQMFGSGATMKTMLDPENNYKYMAHISKNFTDWTPWGLSSDGQHFDWSEYPQKWQDKYAAESESSYTSWYGKYPQYSRGAFRVEDDQLAKIHQNEMVLPAEMAEEVRHEYGHHTATTTFNIVIAEASSSQAVRFAQRMKTVLESSVV
jgi:cell wall-associated NlpC family hydrolase